VAQNKDNVLTKGLSGSFGKTMSFRQKAGKTIVAKLPRPRTAAPSDKALAVRKKFLSSLAYGKIAIRDLATKAYYKSKAADGQSAFNMAVADAFSPPEVTHIDTTNYHGVSADSITVQANDLFKVVSVKVSIKGSDGTLLEEGLAAQQANTVDWLYTAKGANASVAGSKISAVATDLPGNTHSLEVTL
jgi:hypothetical protein